MRGPLRIAIDLVQRGAAAADVVRHIFGIRRTTDTGWHVGTHDLQADAVAAPEQVGRRHEFDRVAFDNAGRDLLLCLARQGVPRPPRLRAMWIERAMRSL